MELVEGETLLARVRRAGGLPVDAVLEIGAQVADALAAAEARGLTHRDLKPANLMLVEGESVNVKVIDFGLAKAAANTDPHLTGSEEFVGTPAFASPEQFEGGSGLDARSDFYALGATLWFALTGTVPFAGKTPNDIHRLQIQAPLPLTQLRAARVPAPLVELLRTLLSADPAGRPQTARELYAALARCRVRIVRRSPMARGRIVAVAAMGLAVLALAGWMMLDRSPPPPVPLPIKAPEKSVAVLPFDNLSADAGSAYFADGVQDDILTNLARVADLKVIARGSVQSYRPSAQRPALADIGRALGAVYLVEGSVRRDAGRVRVNAQLVEAASGRQLWADTFDRELSDVIAIQSQVAGRIAAQLQARLSPAERAGLDARPTQDAEAYDLYLRGKELLYDYQQAPDRKAALLDAVRLLDEATTRDPDFVLAFCLLAQVHDNLYFFKFDPSVARLALAESALAAATRLRPDLGETHLARALNFYWGHRDYPAALAELTLARRTLPNNARIPFIAAAIARRQGRWDDGWRGFERAAELDPRHLDTLLQLANSYFYVHRYDDALRVLDRASAAGLPRDITLLTGAIFKLAAQASTAPLHAALAAMTTGWDPDGRATAWSLRAAIYDRDYASAARILSAFQGHEIDDFDGFHYPRAWFDGLVAQAQNDPAGAQTFFTAARAEQEAISHARPDEPTSLAVLAQIDAALGRHDEAVNEARHAVELRPVSKDALDGGILEVNLAQVYARLGEKDLALAKLDEIVPAIHAIEYVELRLDPVWDPLRGDPRFGRIAARLAPTVTGTKP